MAARHNRKLARSAYHSSYRFPEYQMDGCWYCGDPCDSKDHVPALSLAAAVPKWARWLIPSCRECNSLLGARAHRNPWERREAVRNLLRKKYARILKFPLWTPAELAEVGDEMRRSIEASMRMKDYVEQRLSSGLMDKAFRWNAWSIDDAGWVTEQ